MIQFRFEHFKETTSTNTLVLEHARKGEREGLVIVADYQTAGRGKPGNTWESPAGKNLLFSVLVRPPLTAAEAPILTQIACRAVAKVLNEKYHIASSFKRPNDILAKGKKICGILTESLSTGNKLEAAVIGIGLDVNADANQIPDTAISMKLMTGQEYSRKEIMEHILQELARALAQFKKESHG